MPMFARSAAIVTLMVDPLWIVVTPAICHPATTYLRSGRDDVVKTAGRRCRSRRSGAGCPSSQAHSRPKH